MIRDCPRCGLANPPTATHCDCGYDFVAREVDRARAPKHQDRELSLLQSARFGRLAGAGIVCAMIGLVMLLVEGASDEPDAWAFVRAILLMVFGMALFVFLIWRSKR